LQLRSFGNKILKAKSINFQPSLIKIPDVAKVIDE